MRVAKEEGRARGHGVEWKLDRSFGAHKPKGANLRRNFDFVLFGTSPLVVNVAGSAKREKGVENSICTSREIPRIRQLLERSFP